MPIYNPNYKNWQVCKSIKLKKYFEIVGKFRDVLYLSKNILLSLFIIESF